MSVSVHDSVVDRLLADKLVTDAKDKPSSFYRHLFAYQGGVNGYDLVDQLFLKKARL